MKVTVVEHISNMIRWYWTNKRIGFRTRDIQALSERGEVKFGYRLGSPSTYDRTFRQMKMDGLINVEERTTNTDSIWVLKGHAL